MLSVEKITLSGGRWMEKRINKMFTREASEVESNTIALAAGIKLKHEQDSIVKLTDETEKRYWLAKMARKK